MSLPMVCRDCKLEGTKLEMCHVRKYQFEVLLKKCPREVPSPQSTTQDVRSIPLPSGEDIPVKAEPPQPKEKQIEAEPPKEPQKVGETEISSMLEKPIALTSNNIMVSNISIANLELGVLSPRMQFDLNYIAKLAEDIEAEGLLKPIVVRPHPTEMNRYQVIDGEHRIRALQKLGKPLVRAEVHTLSDAEAYFRAMRINQQHGKRLEELEEGSHIAKMMALFNYTEEEIAKRFGRARSWVSQRRSLAVSLAPKLEEYVVRRLTSISQAVELSELPKEEQEKVAEKIVEKKLKSRATRGLVHAFKKATLEQKTKILQKPLDVYARTFKTPEHMEKALLSPTVDFIEKMREIRVGEVLTEQCPSCGKQIRIDWAKREISWV